MIIAFGISCFALLVFFRAIASKWELHSLALPVVKRPVSKPVELILMLMERSEGWNTDAYRFWHKTGVGMWIANGKSSIAVRMTNGNDVWPDTTVSRRLSQTDYIVLTSHEEKLIWKAYQDIIDCKISHDNSRHLIELAQRIQTFSNELELIKKVE